jgi:pimeloyl-ACP methyl ester carboxylesterase
MQMYYVLHGRGEPLVLLHGFTGSSADWSLFFDDLAGGYRLVIPDLRGHGRSTNPSDEFTFRQCARDVFALLDHLNIGQFKAIGLSGGGNSCGKAISMAMSKFGRSGCMDRPFRTATTI